MTSDGVATLERGLAESQGPAGGSISDEPVFEARGIDYIPRDVRAEAERVSSGEPAELAVAPR